MTYIHTLGDSTLDNLYWMLEGSALPSAKRLSVEGQLREKGHHVFSHAYDGFTTRSILDSGTIGAVLAPNSTKISYMEEKAPNGNIVSPLVDLQKKISEYPDTTHYVVLSVGGNDFRVHLLDPDRLKEEIPEIQKRYLEIVEKIKNLAGKNIHPILMFQYLTDANSDPYLIYTIFGMSGVIELMESFYRPILEQAKEDRIPVLDLPNTFNPYDSLFCMGIKPNQKGGELIAEGIDHIVSQHDFSKESCLYSKKGDSYTKEINANPSSWKVDSLTKSHK